MSSRTSQNMLGQRILQLVIKYVWMVGENDAFRRCRPRHLRIRPEDVFPAVANNVVVICGTLIQLLMSATQCSIVVIFLTIHSAKIDIAQEPMFRLVEARQRLPVPSMLLVLFLTTASPVRREPRSALPTGQWDLVTANEWLNFNVSTCAGGSTTCTLCTAHILDIFSCTE
jgi:hypothetical protein